MKVLRKNLSKLVFAVLAPFAIGASEYNSEISFGTSYPNAVQSCYVKFGGTLFDRLKSDHRAWVVSPSVSYFLNGTAGFSVAGGIRHDVWNVSLGNHLIFNCFSDQIGSIYQVGKCVDVLHDNWEARVSYYAPSRGRIPQSSMLYATNSLIDGEVIYKTPFFNFGVGHQYDFTEKRNTSNIKVSLPLEKFSIGTNIAFPQDGAMNVGFSISYNLFSSPKTERKVQSATYRTCPKFTWKNVKKEEPKLPPIPESPKVAPPKQPTWSEWLFGYSNQYGNELYSMDSWDSGRPNYIGVTPVAYAENFAQTNAVEVANATTSPQHSPDYGSAPSSPDIGASAADIASAASPAPNIDVAPQASPGSYSNQSWSTNSSLEVGWEAVGNTPAHAALAAPSISPVPEGDE